MALRLQRTGGEPTLPEETRPAGTPQPIRLTRQNGSHRQPSHQTHRGQRDPAMELRLRGRESDVPEDV